MDLKRVTTVLESVGLAEKYKDTFIEQKLNDSSVEGWMDDISLANEKLKAVMPEMDNRTRFIKSFLTSSTDKENMNAKSNGEPIYDGMKLKPALSREEIISVSTLEALETFMLLISVAEESFDSFGEYFLDETFFQRYSQCAEKKIIHIFKSRCELADLDQLDVAIAKLCRLIQAKKNNLVYTNLLRKIRAEKGLELDVQLMIDKYIAGVKSRIGELEQQDKFPTIKDLESINETVLESVLGEFDKKEPRSSVFRDAKEELDKRIQNIYATFVNTESSMDVNMEENGVEKNVPEPPKSFDPSNLQIVLRKQKLTKAWANSAEAEMIATYDLLMEVMEESFDNFSEDFLDKEILERFSKASETTALKTAGTEWMNFTRLYQVRQLIESENENLVYPNQLRKIEAKETMEMEVQEIINRYKIEMTCKLKEGQLAQHEIEKHHECLQQKHVREFVMKEPRSTLFRDARCLLISKIKTEFEIFTDEIKAAEEKMKVEGRLAVQNSVRSYRETMEGAIRSGLNFDVAHNVAKTVCLKTVENALRDQSREFVELFLNEAESRMQVIHDGLLTSGN